MSKTVPLAALAAALAMAGAAQAQTPIPPSPKDFVMASSQGDQYEIMAANLAMVQGQDPRVRAFAETMRQDHARMNQDLRKAAQEAGLPAPDAGMSSDQAALLSGLQGLRGAAFDKAYAGQQVLVHTQALAVDDSVASAGTNPTVTKAAQAALPIIRDHLAMAKQLDTALGGH